MVQANIWGVPQASPALPTEYAQRDKGSLDALLSTNRGASRPNYALPGTHWVRPINANEEHLYFFDGTQDLYAGRYDVQAGVFYPVSGGSVLTATGANINAVTDPNNGVWDAQVPGVSVSDVELTPANTQIDVLEKDLGQVTVGDYLLINFKFDISNYATPGDIILRIEKSTGTGEFSVGENEFTMGNSLVANGRWNDFKSVIGWVTTTGTLSIRLRGSSSPGTALIGIASFDIKFLRKQ